VSGELYVQLDDDPIIVLVRRGEQDDIYIKEFMSEYFDSSDFRNGIKNGVRYYCRPTAFTRNYWTVMITPAE